MAPTLSRFRWGTEKGHLDVEDVAEGSEAGVEQDVADFRDDFPGGRVDRQRERRLVGQQLLEHGGAALIEHQQRVAGHRARKNLVNAGDIAGDELLERLCHLVDRMNGDFRHFEQHAVPRQLRQGRRRPAEADIEQLDERVLLNGSQFHYCDPSSTLRITASRCSRSTGLLTKALAPAA